MRKVPTVVMVSYRGKRIEVKRSRLAALALKCRFESKVTEDPFDLGGLFVPVGYNGVPSASERDIYSPARPLVYMGFEHTEEYEEWRQNRKNWSTNITTFPFPEVAFSGSRAEFVHRVEDIGDVTCFRLEECLAANPAWYPSNYKLRSRKCYKKVLINQNITRTVHMFRCEPCAVRYAEWITRYDRTGNKSNAGLNNV